MGSGTLALDNVLSATFYFVAKWSPDCHRNQGRDLLRYLLCRLYDEGRGNFFTAHLPLAQTTLAKKLGLSRQWVGELVRRLEQAGWIRHYSPTLPDGTNGSTIFTIGPQLKRLLITLAKSHRRKSPMKATARTHWHFSPTPVEKKQILIREKEELPPSETVLSKIPLLKRWLERGQTG